MVVCIKIAILTTTTSRQKQRASLSDVTFSEMLLTH